MMIMPYLNFNGDCEEAFQLYRRAFGGQEPLLARYSDAPRTAYPDLPEHYRNKIMHGHVMLTETGGVSGADVLAPLEKGSAIHIHVYCTDVAHAQRVFDTLAESGEILGKLAPNPPPYDNGVSGAVRDKFGFTWVLSAQIAQ